MPDLPEGTVTFLFSDVEGSTRLIGELGQGGFADALEEHNDVVRGAIDGSGGVVVRTEGDAFFAVFLTADAGIDAAVAAQRALHALDGSPIRVRIGLHSGTGTLGGDDYIGIDVHRASRIADAGHGGQVLVSATTASLCTPHDGVSLRDVGEHRLKDLDDLEQLYQVDIDGLPTDFPALRTVRPPNNIPERLTSFIGRQEDLARLQGLLTDSRLLTLTGPGGTGKTSLAAELARMEMQRFPDGTYFVDLSDVADVDLVPTTVLLALGMHTTAAGVMPIDHLTRYLADKRVLLVLDNFEQLLAAAQVVAAMLQGCPEVHIVATSRVPLRVAGEQEVPVHPLAVPDGAGNEAAESESVQLFVDRARAIRPDFDPSGDDAVAIARLTARLEGLPLAIELAASRVRLLSPQAILDRLDNRLLADTSARLPSRQQTIVNTIGWSYDLLDETTRRLFERCAVFVGGARLDEIEAVIGTPGDFDLLDGLATLVDHSLLRRIDRDDQTRFTMLLVIRDFAHGALVAAGDEEEYRARHATVYRSLAEDAGPSFLTSQRVAWLDRLDAEHDNILAALDWAFETGSAEVALTIAAGMWRFWQTRGYLVEAVEWVRRALAVPGDDPVLRANALEALAGLLYWQGDAGATREPYLEAMMIMREHGTPAQLGNALTNASWSYIYAQDFDAAGHVLDEATAIYEDLGDEYGKARAKWARFNLFWYEGIRDGVPELARTAVDAFQQLDAPFDLGWAYYALADSHVFEDDIDEALNALDQGLPIFAEAGDLSAMVLFLSVYAVCAAISDDRQRAAVLAGAAASIKERTGVALMESPEWDTASNTMAEILDGLDEFPEFQEGLGLSPDEAVAFALDR